MSLAFNKVFQAIYNTLTADSVLMSRIVAVYDHVPDGDLSVEDPLVPQNSEYPSDTDEPITGEYPYVVIHQADSDPFVTFSRFGETVSVDLYIYSKYRGFKEVNEIMSDLGRLLANVDLSVEDYDTAACMFDSANSERMSDGETRLGVFSVRVMVQKELTEV
jgi:hypothetical protein